MVKKIQPNIFKNIYSKNKILDRPLHFGLTR